MHDDTQRNSITKRAQRRVLTAMRCFSTVLHNHRYLFGLFAVVVVLLWTRGSIQRFESNNQALEESTSLPNDGQTPIQKRESDERFAVALSQHEQGDPIFLGIAISGGGSRAANFSAAVLFALERLGILKHATVISSVSGGSLTAAYYGLWKDDASRWNEHEVYERLGIDFESKWITQFIKPTTAIKAWFTRFDRSQVMAEVFDEHLYHQARFGDFRSSPKRIFLNASLYFGEGMRFPFSEDTFRDLAQSKLATYPVAHAVMASAAFPGAFRPINLSVAKLADGGHGYLHLIDGGPTDNRGIETLAQAYIGGLFNETVKAPPCMWIVIDASVPSAPGFEMSLKQPNFGRSVIDALIDSSVLTSSDMLLRQQWIGAYERLGYRDVRIEDREFEDMLWPTMKRHTPSNAPIVEVDPLRVYDNHMVKREGLSCMVWVISFRRILSLAGFPSEFEATRAIKFAPEDYSREQKDRLALYQYVTRIPTRFALVHESGDSPSQIQAQIRRAVEEVCAGDRETIEKVGQFLMQHGVGELRLK